jgi:hypothetical protein
VCKINLIIPHIIDCIHLEVLVPKCDTVISGGVVSVMSIAHFMMSPSGLVHSVMKELRGDLMVAWPKRKVSDTFWVFMAHGTHRLGSLISGME